MRAVWSNLKLLCKWMFSNWAIAVVEPIIGDECRRAIVCVRDNSYIYMIFFLLPWSQHNLRLTQYVALFHFALSSVILLCTPFSFMSFQRVHRSFLWLSSTVLSINSLPFYIRAFLLFLQHDHTHTNNLLSIKKCTTSQALLFLPDVLISYHDHSCHSI